MSFERGLEQDNCLWSPATDMQRCLTGPAYFSQSMLTDRLAINQSQTRFMLTCSQLLCGDLGVHLLTNSDCAYDQVKCHPLLVNTCTVENHL